MDLVEPLAAVLGLIAVILVVRESIWCWPFGLAQVTLYVIVFFNAKLYSDFLLHLIFVGVQLYGWYHWVYGSQTSNRLPVSSLNYSSLTAWMALTAAGTVGWGYLMAANTDADFPYGDAFTTVASLPAMWFQARKMIQTWHFWIAVDVVAIVIYYHKELYYTTGLYAVFLVLCIVGLLSWRRSMSTQAVAT